MAIIIIFIKKYSSVDGQMNGLENQHNAALVIVLIPRKAQLYDEDWKAYQEAYSNYEVDRAKPQKLLSGICYKNAIKCIDLYPSFKREAKATPTPTGKLPLTIGVVPTTFTALSVKCIEPPKPAEPIMEFRRIPGDPVAEIVFGEAGRQAWI